MLPQNMVNNLKDTRILGGTQNCTKMQYAYKLWIICRASKGALKAKTTTPFARPNRKQRRAASAPREKDRQSHITYTKERTRLCTRTSQTRQTTRVDRRRFWSIIAQPVYAIERRDGTAFPSPARLQWLIYKITSHHTKYHTSLATSSSLPHVS